MSISSKIIGSRYVLAVQDLEKSSQFYIQKLGFESDWKGDGWHFLKRGKFYVMLGECPDDRSAFDTRNHSYFAYIDVENIVSLFEEYEQAQVEILSKLANKPWGQREFSIRTIDGHRIMFGEAIDSSQET